MGTSSLYKGPKSSVLLPSDFDVTNFTFKSIALYILRQIIQTVSTRAQWVKNPIAEVQVTMEVQVQPLAWHSG